MHRLLSRGAVPALLLLVACSGHEPPPTAQVRSEPPPRDLLAEVRAAAADAGDVIEVQPLRDPGVEDLLARAQQAESARKWKRAERALREALQLSPQDPELIQRHAEVLLAQRRLDEAEQLALQSFELGPKLGTLCRRNWATARLAREERGDAPGASSAIQQLERCIIEPPVRM